MGETPNQKECCNIVVSILERLDNDVGHDQYAPDEHEQRNPATDWHVSFAGKHYWIEHTQIEPYEKAIEGDVKFGPLDAILKAKEYASVPDHVSLTIGISHKVYNISPKIFSAFAEQLTIAVNEKIPSLRDLNEDVPFRNIHFKINGIEISFMATIKTHKGGNISFTRIVPTNLEDLRFIRIERAIREKSKKFQDLVGPNNKAVLILEIKDTILSAHPNIISKIEKLYANASYVPNELFLIDSYQSPWQVWHLISNQQIKPDRYQML